MVAFLVSLRLGGRGKHHGTQNGELQVSGKKFILRW
jgi:hypothetical protein